ncbi:hypothetical protein HDV05_006046 [Chytridiales sp. JEL 0842]|nr:hypothetical protein HDV05_006046 [Chytridiales sp. JEL 0842]
MVKLYLRYKQSHSFGVINSGNSNVCYDQSGRLAICPSLEDVVVWDVKKAIKVATWHDDDNKAEVTCIARSEVNDKFAVGYSDGSIRIWTLSNSSAPLVTFTGHKAAVTALSFDSSSHRLVSGSKDTDLVVWDVLGERGLYRLRGHKDQVNGVKFVESGTSGSEGHVVSVSKDTMMKFWDLTTQHCVETTIAHRSEVWALQVLPAEYTVDFKSLSTSTSDETPTITSDTSSNLLTLLTGGAEGEVRVWKLDTNILTSKLEPSAAPSTSFQTTASEDLLQSTLDSAITARAIQPLGILERQSKERVVSIVALPRASGRCVAVQGADRLVEVYKLRSEPELKRRLGRLRRRKNEKKKGETTINGEETLELSVQDYIPRVSSLRAAAKIRSIDICPLATSTTSTSSFHILCALSNNQIETHTAHLDAKEDPISHDLTFDTPGHRADIRTLALSSDNELLLSGSHAGVKLWNLETSQCIATMESGYALCSTFVPGDNYVIVGTKTGELEIFDLRSSTMIESIKAHDGPIWSLQMWADKRGITTGSADKDVKFWEFALVELEPPEGSKTPLIKKKQLTLTHTRTLKLSDDVLCVRHSHDGKLLAVSLLDCTIKVFYVDTLKFFLSLYGHKLPVMSLDISSDSTLLISGSADKSIKIWGLDFGDCHRSLGAAHSDSVMGVQFVFGTHYFFSVGKDKGLKYWDADKFEQIMKLEGHHGEIWGLCVGKYGKFVVTGSHDRSIRVWEKTEEQFTLDEERERELEEVFERAALEDKEDGGIGTGVDEEVEGGLVKGNKEEVGEVGAAGKKTVESLKAGERLVQALEIWEEEVDAQGLYEKELKKWEASKKANPKYNEPKPKPEPRNPFIIASRLDGEIPEAYVLFVANAIRGADLEQALMVLNLERCMALLGCIKVWIEKGWNLPLASRILTHLLTTHSSQLISTRSCLPLLSSIQKTLTLALKAQRETVNFNLEALKYLKREWDAEHSVEFDAAGNSFVFGGFGAQEEKKGDGKKEVGKKRKRVVLKS